MAVAPPKDVNIVQKISYLIMSPLFVRILLILPFLLSLYLLTEKSENETEGERGRLSVFVALASHPPSNRVFRAISQIVLLLFCAAFSLKVWEGTLGQDIIGFLLFQPDDTFSSSSLEEIDFQDDEDDNLEDSVFNPDDEVGIEEDLDAHIRGGSSEKEFLAPKPPSAVSVACAAADLLLFLLVCLLLFTYSHTSHFQQLEQHGMVTVATPIVTTLSGIATPIFPLVLFICSAAAVIFPWSKRVEFLKITRRTLEAPFYSVTFRDGFIGDILTSTVRPLQDLTFTLFYLFSGLQGWWSSQYNLDQAAAPVEHSWLVYTVLIPACVVSPLWWRFLQNLRQAHDSRQRWPYLGNALKYFLAAQVALFGVFTPSLKKSSIWITSFVMATLYQIWWDTFMDWQLFTKDNKSSNSIFPSYTLRPNRLYPNKSLYIFIFIVNLLLRFCWTLSFLPPQTLSQAGIIIDTFGSDFETFISPVLATAEIIRRTLWGLLRVEWEALKTIDFETNTQSNSVESEAIEIELEMMEVLGKEGNKSMQSMTIESSLDDSFNLNVVSTSIIPNSFSMLRSDMSHSSDIQIMGELCIWATAFMSVGIVAAAYKQ